MIFGLENWEAATLIVCLIAACTFEFINGFHDTANAVATVIYTNTLKPWVAVVWSGLCNIAGVMTGGIAVAMGIVYLLPVELLADQNTYHAVAMIIALLGAGIIWNFSTWYLGIPCSSSHTLVAAILGVGVAYSLLPGSQGSAVNWEKAADVGTALLISPFLGFAGTLLLMFLLRFFTKNKSLFEEPKKGSVPPTWIRGILIFTCSSVSFFHGSNDGQKGVGIVMLILIGLVPLQFAINPQTDFNAMSSASMEISTTLDEVARQAGETSALKAGAEVLSKELKTLSSNVASGVAASQVNSFELRQVLVAQKQSLERFEKRFGSELSSSTREIISTQKAGLVNTIDYAPFWVILMVSVSIGVGTMIGWKRIVVTIGEKIGKQHLTYAQGASAEFVAASTIAFSTFVGLPVSTTQVLSSGIAGSMVAGKGLKNLQFNTIRTMAIAWLLTFPVVFMLAGTIFYLLRNLIQYSMP